LFRKFNTDRQPTDCDQLLDSCPGSSCWIIGAGPSLLRLSQEEIKLIEDSPAAKFAVNHAGRRKDGSWIIKPNYWTAYDMISKFSRALFNDPGITKFVHVGRFLQTIPGGAEEKLCDCPNTYFFEKECRGYANFFDPRTEAILEAQDSFIQAIDIAFRLGFRHVYCIGTEMRVWLSDAQRAYAESVGIQFQDDLAKVTDGRWSDRLALVTAEIAKKTGMKLREAYQILEEQDREFLYCFGETKNLEATVNCDEHYWQRVQFVRLAKRNMALNGFSMVSCTPNSRLNGVLRTCDVTQACREIDSRHGTYVENLIGRYTERHIPDRYPYVDIPMYNRNNDPVPIRKTASTIPDVPGRLEELKQLLGKDLNVD
jgi:hypothetical protein